MDHQPHADISGTLMHRREEILELAQRISGGG
jgi:hypothetical protein